MGRSRKPRLPSEPAEADIESIDQEGRGVTHVGGKAVFVYGALPGEKVRFRYVARKRRHDEGSVIEVLKPSADRVEPRCPHFGVCGGCSLQHMDPEQQILAKQTVLLESIERIGKTAMPEVLPPLRSPDTWGYRRKARLGVKYVAKKGKVLVGFRERGSAFITDLSRCEVLHPRVGERIEALGQLVEGLSIRERVPQIEVSMGDEVCVLVFRVLEPPSESDIASMLAFGDEHEFSIYLQEGGPDTVKPARDPAKLHYHLSDAGVSIEFLPSDFTQVNSGINRLMVARALGLLGLAPQDAVLDLFCGLGNFTLPIARKVSAVTGVEGDAGLVARARGNAEANGLSNTRFFTSNLYELQPNEPWLDRRYNKALLDPPRSGAMEVLEHLPRLGVDRLVYVSCYPGTLARDTDVLVNQLGYRLLSAGVMDMFPHTAHVESIALFERA